MENKNGLLTCEEVMDELDRSPLAEMTGPFHAHISGCRSCTNYMLLGRKLAVRADKDPDLDRWNGFVSSLDRFSGRQKRFRLTSIMAGGVAAAVLTVLLTVSLVVKNNGMTTADKGNLVASNGSYMTPASDYNPETSDLNYYYEISFKN
jgi:hypothetical protein